MRRAYDEAKRRNTTHYKVFDLCTTCAAEIACEELRLQEAFDGFGTRCECCGETLDQRGIKFFYTTTDRTTLGSEQLIQLFAVGRQRAIERRERAILERNSGVHGIGGRDC